MIKTKLIIIINKHKIRLNTPHTTGITRKVDKWLFKYNKSRGLPCFLPFIEFKRQLIVDGQKIYSGGGVNCFNETMKVYPVTVNKEQLEHCKYAYKTGFFKIRNFEYNGFMGRELPGYTNYTVRRSNFSLTNDPGIWYCDVNDKYIPEYAIEGIQILKKPATSNDIPLLFGYIN